MKIIGIKAAKDPINDETLNDFINVPICEIIPESVDLFLVGPAPSRAHDQP
jgi:hypothetical protein